MCQFSIFHVFQNFPSCLLLFEFFFNFSKTNVVSHSLSWKSFTRPLKNAEIFTVPSAVNELSHESPRGSGDLPTAKGCGSIARASGHSRDNERLPWISTVFFGIFWYFCLYLLVFVWYCLFFCEIRKNPEIPTKSNRKHWNACQNIKIHWGPCQIYSGWPYGLL